MTEISKGLAGVFAAAVLMSACATQSHRELVEIVSRDGQVKKMDVTFTMPFFIAEQTGDPLNGAAICFAAAKHASNFSVMDRWSAIMEMLSPDETKVSKAKTSQDRIYTNPKDPITGKSVPVKEFAAAQLNEAACDSDRVIQRFSEMHLNLEENPNG